MSLLSVKNVSKAYGLRHVLENITMDVQVGDRIGLIGPTVPGNRLWLKLSRALKNRTTEPLRSPATRP